MGEPAVAFAKMVLEVLSLDRRAGEQVEGLRKVLFRLLHVKESSAASQFRDPCLAFVLKDVICSYCNDCRHVRPPLAARSPPGC